MKFVLLLTIVMGLIRSSVSHAGNIANDAGGSEAHGMPDPTYFSCLEAGGTFFRAERTSDNDVTTSAAPSANFCKLDTAEVGALTFYRTVRKKVDPRLVAITAFLSSSYESSPSVNCSNWGAADFVFVLDDKKPLIACIFLDSSIIALDTLRSGCTATGNQKLREAVLLSATRF